MATTTRVANAVRSTTDRSLVVVSGAAVLVCVTAVWGGWLDRLGDGIGLHAAPLFGAARNRFGAVVLLPIVVAAFVVWRGDELANRVAWRKLLVAAFLITVMWGVSLALVDHGVDGLLRGVRSPHDLLAGVDRIEYPGVFLRTFVDRIDDYVVHVRGHPPGLLIGLWLLPRIGLGGAASTAALAIMAGGVAVVAALIACRELAGEAHARRAAPFLLVSPAAIWMVTSADAIYAGVGAAGVAALLVAIERRSDVLSVVGGLLLGIGIFMSYGLVLLLAIPCVIALERRRVRPTLIAGVGILAVGVVFAVFGFSWIDGILATRTEYAESIAAIRPYGYFVFANLAAFAIVLGPGPLGGLGGLRDRRLWLLGGSALFAVLVADLSGLSKGEVERIWLPFWPWVALAAAGLRSRIRWWLAAQAVVAIGVQTFIGTPW